MLSMFGNMKSCTAQLPPAQDMNYLSVQNVHPVCGTCPVVTQALSGLLDHLGQQHNVCIQVTLTWVPKAVW